MTLVDTNGQRRALADAIGCAFASPDAAPRDCDMVVHSLKDLPTGAHPGLVIGATPKRALPVSSGNHVLLLECPPLGRQARVPLKLAADEHRHVLVDLNADPPTVTWR